MKKILLMILLFLFMGSLAANAFDHGHAAFTRLLKRHVVMGHRDKTSCVDYKQFKKDQTALRSYLETLSSVSGEEFDTWDKNRQLAFLINAYNAFTIELILNHYPVASIKDIGSFLTSPWKIKFIPLFGETVHLDNIEHDMIRAKGKYDEPRIHFALVCASKGCPPLLNEAFTWQKLNLQLNDNLKRFLSDTSKNRYDADRKTLYVSSIFKWFKEDFRMGYGSVEDFFASHADLFSAEETDRETIKKKKQEISYLDYDWHLNDI